MLFTCACYVSDLFHHVFYLILTKGKEYRLIFSPHPPAAPNDFLLFCPWTVKIADWHVHMWLQCLHVAVLSSAGFCISVWKSSVRLWHRILGFSSGVFWTAQPWSELKRYGSTGPDGRSVRLGRLSARSPIHRQKYCTTHLNTGLYSPVDLLAKEQNVRWDLRFSWRRVWWISMAFRWRCLSSRMLPRVVW
jgi:hypothetical protein